MITRKVENGYEYVTLTYFKTKDKFWVSIVEIIQKNMSESDFRTWLASESGYPKEEVGRIKDVIIEDEKDCLVIKVTFRNPGKQFEQFLREAKEYDISNVMYLLGLMDMPKDALEWETTTSGKLKSTSGGE